MGQFYLVILALFIGCTFAQSTEDAEVSVSSVVKNFLNRDGVDDLDFRSATAMRVVIYEEQLYLLIQDHGLSEALIQLNSPLVSVIDGEGDVSPISGKIVCYRRNYGELAETADVVQGFLSPAKVRRQDKRRPCLLPIHFTFE